MYGLTNREYEGRKIIFEDEIISVLKKEYDDDFPPNIGREKHGHQFYPRSISEYHEDVCMTFLNNNLCIKWVFRG